MEEGSEFEDWKAVKGLKKVLAFFFSKTQGCVPQGHTLIPTSSIQRPKISSSIFHSL